MDRFNFNEFDSHIGLIHIMRQKVYNYVQYVIVNNTHDNQSFKGGGETIIIYFIKYMHIRFKILLKQI